MYDWKEPIKTMGDLDKNKPHAGIVLNIFINAFNS